MSHCRRHRLWVVVVALLAGCSMTAPFEPIDRGVQKAKYVILMVGDGMGAAQILAADLYRYGEPGRLPFEQFPHRAMVHTNPADRDVTDSAASITAMVTGVKVNTRVLGLRIPGDGSELETVLETLHGQGWATGIVTTAFLTHATPAGLVAHVADRDEYDAIAEQIVADALPNVMFGGGRYLMADELEGAGYDVVVDEAQMDALPRTADHPAAGLFSKGHLPYELDGLGAAPRLPEMTRTAIEILETDEDGFFLMVEGARIDLACHDSDIQRAVWETLAFSEAVTVAMAFYEAHADETLLIVVADHETGGLEVVGNNGMGAYPTVIFHTANDNGYATHTDTPVPYFGIGIGADPGGPQLQNNEIHGIMMDAVAGTY